MSSARWWRRYSLKHQGRDRLPVERGCNSQNHGLIILGIDPGTVNLGYGIIRQNSREYEYVSSGVLKIPKTKVLHERLRIIYEGLEDIIKRYSPQVAVIEKIFFAGGVKATLNLGYSRGVAMLAVARYDIPIYEYSTLEVKKAITGYGRADKVQVGEMVKRLLFLNKKPDPDSADALALCICHAHNILTRIR
jgi:crossover junction endodeoxyribonuclease RuvC